MRWLRAVTTVHGGAAAVLQSPSRILAGSVGDGLQSANKEEGKKKRRPLNHLYLFRAKKRTSEYLFTYPLLLNKN